MTVDRPDQKRIEFWAFLRSQETVQRAVEKIEFLAISGKRQGMRNWSWVEGGLHSDDVALVKLVADGLGLREGVDWDWQLEPDSYHYSVAYVDTAETRELSRLVELYHDAAIVFMQVKLRADENLSDEELQKVFLEEWSRLRQEKHRMEDETMQAIRKSLGKVFGR